MRTGDVRSKTEFKVPLQPSAHSKYYLTWKPQYRWFTPDICVLDVNVAINCSKIYPQDLHTREPSNDRLHAKVYMITVKIAEREHGEKVI